jgi:glycine hydroxymethyltransferase
LEWVSQLPSPKESHDQVLQLLQEHHKWFSESIPLIASENVPSPAVREAIISDFGNRYAEGWVGERVYAGCIYIDQVERLCIELAKQLFRAEFVDVRPVSGVCANLVVYTTFTNPGDRMLALAIPNGGHISMGRKDFAGTAGAVHGLDVDYFVFDRHEMNIDVDKTKQKVEKMVKEESRPPKLAMFGGSLFLFPHPVKELVDTFRGIGAKVAYDAAHVAGLIAGGQFQDPLREGADVVCLSTHKTLFGPQGGTVLSWDKYGEDIKKATFPSNTSNHHLHNLAGKAVAFAEMLEFGKEYAEQVITNAKALGQALHERGLTVLAEHKGFTASHQVVVDVTKYGLGGDMEKALETANIIVNRQLIPGDIQAGRHYQNPGGLRIGTSEITRIGMNKNDMTEVAEFIKRVVIDKQDPRKVKQDVGVFRQKFQEVRYCFEKAKKAYEYIRIR